MKSYLLIGLLVVVFLPNLFGEIKNGYEKNIPRLKYSLAYLRNQLATNADLTAHERRKMRRKISEIVNTLAYAEVTYSLLKNFKAIAADVYNEIDTLKDSAGRIVDVYVKFIPKERAKFDSYGMVSFEPSPDDAGACNSEYGKNSVSVVIWILNNSLVVLSHEFGHLQYIIPNLTSYVQYYKNVYGPPRPGHSFGHRCDDQGGKHAHRFERRYRESYSRFLKQGDRSTSPYALLNPARQKVLKEVDFRGWEFVSVTP